MSAQTALAQNTAKLLIHFISTWPDHSNFASYTFAKTPSGAKYKALRSNNKINTKYKKVFRREIQFLF